MEPAFTAGRPVTAFKPSEVLGFDGSSASVKGTFSDDGSDGAATAVVTLRQKNALTSEEELLAQLPRLEVALTNHSGAEYSYYDAVLPAAADASTTTTTTTTTSSSSSSASSSSSSSSGPSSFSVEVIWPASERQVQKKRRAEWRLVSEDPATYRSVVVPHVEEQVKKIQWIDKVCSRAKERERNLYDCDAFVVNVDTKWQSHGLIRSAPVGEDNDNDGGDAAGAAAPGAAASEAEAEAAFYAQERTGWFGAPWTRDLYLLAISKDPALRSLRDLQGEAGAALCDAMAAQLLAAAEAVYGVAADQCRVFFHYHPQFYRLHAHCNRVAHVNPGCEAERAHLLSTVAQNLRILPGYYSDAATLSYKVRTDEKLHHLLAAAGKVSTAGSSSTKQGNDGGGAPVE